jgi:hypothetical protein
MCRMECDELLDEYFIGGSHTVMTIIVLYMNKILNLADTKYVFKIQLETKV